MANVVSLFNGMSVAEMAFADTIGEVDVMYSEVDKHANKLTSTLYPESKPIGDVRDINGEDFTNIDFLVGGSPCQNFSFSGTGQGMVTKDKVEILTLEHYLQMKELGFEFSGQSYLFWEYVRILTETRRNNKNVKFLLENVVMSKKWEELISSVLGVTPTMIDSKLVSGQQRRRLYWTNINSGKISQPEDRKINFRDILENDEFCNSAAIRGRNIECGTIVGRRLDGQGKRKDDDKSIPIVQCLEVRKTNPDKTNCITTVQKDNVITNLPQGRHPGAFTKYIKDVDWRYLTAREALRLQTVPDHIIDSILNTVSENQAYKMAGNGWNLETIKHILSHA